MSNEMTFAQALNEAKSVIVQLSGRVKADAEKVRTQQQTIVAQSATITEAEQKIRLLEETIQQHLRTQASLNERITEIESARAAGEAMINRQGEKIGSLEAARADLDGRLSEALVSNRQVTQERDELRRRLPSEEDNAALASMSSLLGKAAGVLEKVKKTNPPHMRLADDCVVEAA